MFTHLHTHSHYSLLEGLGTIDQLIAKAQEDGASALALTDHNVLYGAIEFYKKCHDAGLKAIIGMEAYVAVGPISDKNPQDKPYHLVLLAQNNIGYQNLLKLTSLAHLEGFYYKPRIDWENLQKYNEGLIALTSGTNGPLTRHILAGQSQQVEKNLQILLNIFGKERLFLEIQARNKPEQKIINTALAELAKKNNLSLVATNDVHYIYPQDDQAHDVLICIQSKHKQGDTDRVTYLGENYAFLDEATMRTLLPDYPEAIANTQKVAELCNLEIELGKIQLPKYDLPAGTSPEDELRRLCNQGLKKRYNLDETQIPSATKERLEYELAIIAKTGFAAYFLIVQDFVNWAKERKIVVGPGRGSAAGSLVSYLIGITNLDPLTYDLLFERFLNPDRISMPDIDLDFADNRRNEVIEYVEKKYGKDHVAQIITFGTMAARASLRDVGRVLGYSYAYCDQIAKMIPMFSTLEEALQNVKELKQIYDQDAEASRLIDMAKKLEGLARHSSTHACGVLITKDPLVNYAPAQYASSDDQTIISQYSLKPVEDLGLLKMDFLGLKNLTILEQAIKIIEATHNVKIDLDRIPLDDEKTFALLQRAETTGVFQLESGGMKRYLKQLQPTALEDIIAMVSLYRPGPMEFIPDYIAGKHGRKVISYLHPKLEPILKNTYGIAIYQEQIMNIARELAGFTYGQADVLRKAVGKKIKKLLDEQEEAMVSGMVKNGIDRKTANKIWEFIIPFARYGFNRSHAACYAMIAYQTAYLKSNYPEAFMAALLTSDQGNIDRITIEINECRKMGLEVMPPEINESWPNFAIAPKLAEQKYSRIRFGLCAIKNVGDHIAVEILHERKKNGSFKSLEDFLQRIKDKDLNKKSLESLIKAGVFDNFVSRGMALGNLVSILDYHKKIQNEHKNGQNNLFSDLPLVSHNLALKLDEFADVSVEQKLSWEKELLGLYISDHPFKKYIAVLGERVTTLNKIRQKNNENVTVAGVITNVHKIITHQGQNMLFVTVEDSLGSLEVIVFPKTLEKTFGLWREENKIMVSGKASDKDGQMKIIVETAQLIDDDYINKIQKKTLAEHKLWISLPADFNKDKMDGLKKILENHPGDTVVYLELKNGQTRKIRTSLKIFPQGELLTALDSYLGEGHINLE